MKTGLERIRDRARQNKQMKFTSLAHHITSSSIKEALKAIPIRSASGVDRLSHSETSASFSEWSETFITGLHQKGYKPPPVRRVNIPKPGKDATRPIGIPCISDRACQGAVTKVLSSIYEEDFLKCSFGGREGLSAHKALGTLEHVLYSKKVSWVIEADLKNFFGSLDHKWILKFLEHRIDDQRIISLIRRWLKAGVLEGGEIVRTSEGTPQGGPVSVLVSNIYLHYVLDLWFEKVVKPRARGEVYIVRYLDDFVICCQYKTDATNIFSTLPKRLGKFGLTLEPTKTALVEFGRFAKQNSLRYGRKLKPIYFLGFTIYGAENPWGNYCIRFKTEKSRHCRALGKIKELLYRNRHAPILYQKRALDRLLGGLYRYYGLSSNANATHKLFLFTERYWRKALSSRSQRGKMNWEKYKKILQYYPILKPKIHVSYADMTRMAIL